jgi:hypothetical protein
MRNKNIKTYKAPPITRDIKEVIKNVCRCPSCNSPNVKLLKVVEDKDNSRNIYDTYLGKDHLFYKYYICKNCEHKFTNLGIEGC